MKQTVSPHFSRLFSALLWGSLFSLFSLNLFSRPEEAFWKNHIAVLKAPTLSDAHLSLAQAYRQKGNWDQAKNELRISASMVLGAASPLDLLKEWEQEPKRIEQKLLFWQDIVAQKPDYRDGFIQLSSLSYQLNNIEQAKTYALKAQTLDPNSPVVGRLLSIFPL